MKVVSNCWASEWSCGSLREWNQQATPLGRPKKETNAASSGASMFWNRRPTDRSRFLALRSTFAVSASMPSKVYNAQYLPQAWEPVALCASTNVG